MINSRSSYFLVSLLLVCCLGCGKDESANYTPEEDLPSPLFSLLPSAQTKVNFQNTLQEGLNTNIFMYEYFYNGGGVAAGDLNADGKTDLYFTSNMGENQLYLNQGGMTFKECSQQSGAAGRAGPWKTGVCMVDINGDSRLDIYLCYSGMLPDPKRANQLFINQGNDEHGIPRFEEQAEQYGLAGTAFSNQAYFFDFDRDSDLDMLLLNHNPKSLPVLNEANTVEFMKQDDPQRGVRLYEQKNGTFTDITEKAGIIGSGLSYGLGIGIADLNDDGWADFYVSNDYTIPDYLYLNNQDGTFTNQLQKSIGHNSHFSMGNDIADINNDGLQDIITLDMLPEDNRRQKLLMAPDNYAKFDLNLRSGFHYQYMRNMFQLNNGSLDGELPVFSEIGQMAGISNTDWSWAALLADYNNDGWKDLYVTNGYSRDYTNLDFLKYMEDYVRVKGRLLREDVLDLINQMPASEVVNYIFANQDGLTFTDNTKAWGMDRPSNSNGAAFADLDNDGDLDLVVNNVNQEAFIYQNQSQRNPENHYLQIELRGEGLNTQGIGAKVSLYSKGKMYRLEQQPSRGYLSSVSPILHAGLGNERNIDSLLIQWAGGKQQRLTNIAADQTILLEEKNADFYSKSSTLSASIFTEIPSPIAYQNPIVPFNDFDRQALLISGLSFDGPCMLKADVNQDGLEDVLIGGAKGKPASLYIQQKNKTFKQQTVADFELDKESEDAALVVFDANGDGHADIFIGSGGYHTFLKEDERLQDRLYLNDGKGNFRKSQDALPEMKQSTAVVAVHDVNGDGFADIFAGSRVIPGRYPEIPESFLLINDGKGHFSNQIQALAPELQKAGLITDAVWADLNQDGQNELLVVGEWMPVSVFGLKNGKLEKQTTQYLEGGYHGWWNTIALADLNSDGKTDFLLGNFGTNTQFQASSKEPAEMYYSDFDLNGAVDPIFCFYIQGKSYPYVTRDELLMQLASLRSRFTTYQSYAGISITDIFDEKTLEKAGKLQATKMETSLFLSTPSGKYELSTLPVQAQYAPVHSIHILDYDADGNDDVLLCGNNSYTKLRLGKMDANYGSLFRGDGKGGLSYVPQYESGLCLKGDVKSIIEIDDYLLFGVNQSEVKAYRRNR